MLYLVNRRPLGWPATHGMALALGRRNRWEAGSNHSFRYCSTSHFLLPQAPTRQHGSCHGQLRQTIKSTVKVIVLGYSDFKSVRPNSSLLCWRAICNARQTTRPRELSRPFETPVIACGNSRPVLRRLYGPKSAFAVLITSHINLVGSKNRRESAARPCQLCGMLYCRGCTAGNTSACCTRCPCRSQDSKTHLLAAKQLEWDATAAQAPAHATPAACTSSCVHLGSAYSAASSTGKHSIVPGRLALLFGYLM